MSKVTSKLQITLPKAIAVHYGIKPGDEVDWIPAGDSIRLVPHPRESAALAVEARLGLFDEATARQQQRELRGAIPGGLERGWSRDELYDRG